MIATRDLQGPINLATDAMTTPTEPMWQAMRDATLGMASAGRDESVAGLEAVAASLMGKEAALLVATGRLGNLLALLSHARRGDQVVLHEYSHILWCEDRSISAVAGLVPRPVAGRGGALDPAAVELAITTRHYSHLPPTGLICLENSFDAGGGTVITPLQTGMVARVAHSHNVPVHLDGSRIFNAAIALHEPVQALVEPVDSVVFSLSKGLGAPLGSLLCGSREFVDEARRNLRALGSGSIHKLGIVAAAGLVAVTTMTERLVEDHVRALRLALALDGIDGVRVDLETVQTNIVVVDVSGTGAPAEAVQARLEARGLMAAVRSRETIRLVTHLDIGDAEIDEAIVIFTAVAHDVMKRN